MVVIPLNSGAGIEFKVIMRAIYGEKEIMKHKKQLYEATPETFFFSTHLTLNLFFLGGGLSKMYQNLMLKYFHLNIDKSKSDYKCNIWGEKNSVKRGEGGGVRGVKQLCRSVFALIQ